MKRGNFTGEYWNVDAETQSITRFRFVRRNNQVYVSAWAPCFITDCEWGRTELHELKEWSEPSEEHHAFAVWDFDDTLKHCLLTLVGEELTVVVISINTDIPSYRMKMTFRKDAARSAAARHADPLDKLKYMWDGSQPGWKLIQYDREFFLVEMNFDESGPKHAEIPAIKELVERFSDVPDEEVWEVLRGCTGLQIGYFLHGERMNRLEQLRSECKLDLSLHRISPDDYLILTPDGGHHGLLTISSYRRPVVERMLAAGVPIVSGTLE